jgi:HD-GYP domain-containing protein (c-di-GMP phosphodiesterase class II)/DNA-binding NarL/FixJ family response regulator
MGDKHISVLLIEDNPGDARFIREMLAEVENPTFDLQHAERLSTGLERLAVGGIDVILLDLLLPESQGLVAFRQVYAQAPEVPIVVLTILGNETLALQTVQEGAQDYLVKGQVDGNLLARSMRYALERKRAAEEVRHHLERVEALREIDRAITSTLDLTEVLNIILEELERVIPYHSAGIFLFSADTAKLSAGRGFPDMGRALQVSFPVEEDALARQLLREKRPLVLVDAQADKRFRARGGTEYVRSWIGVPLIAKGEALGLLTIDHREPGVYDEKSAEVAQDFAGQVAMAIDNARLYQEAQRELAERKRVEEELRQSYTKLQRTLEATVNALVSAVEMKDPYTAGHQRRVAQLAPAIAQEMGFSEEQINGIYIAAIIHDVGKINVPVEILSKPSKLSEAEFGLIRTHPQVGHDILDVPAEILGEPGGLSELELNLIRTHPQVGHDVLKEIDFPWPVAQIVLQHHERMDGSGYPQGLSGEEILLEARILAVADVVEAMASHRPYRPAYGLDKALDEISQNAGVLYDPGVVDACLRLFTKKGFSFK